MAKAKTLTWQELRDRGGPYTVEELRVLYDRPGMNRLGSNAWCCDTCGAIRGTYMSADVDAYHRERGTFIERVGPEPPQEVLDAEARMIHACGVYDDIGRQVAEAFQDREKAAAVGSSGHTPGQMVNTQEDERQKAFRAARVASVDARIAQLQSAHLEANEVRGVAMREYQELFSAWRHKLWEAERAANQPPEPPKPSALERFLAGALKA